MSQLEVIRHQFHDLIDHVNDESVLSRYLGAISSEVNGTDTNLWGDITPEEQAEILEAYEESKDVSTWTSHEEVKSKYEKWLTK